MFSTSRISNTARNFKSHSHGLSFQKAKQVQAVTLLHGLSSQSAEQARMAKPRLSLQNAEQVCDGLWSSQVSEP